MGMNKMQGRMGANLTRFSDFHSGMGVAALGSVNPYPRTNPDPPGTKYWADPNTRGVDRALLQQMARTPVSSLTDCKNLGANGNPYIRSDGAVLYYKDYQGNKIPYDPTDPDSYVADYYGKVWQANQTGSYDWIPWYLPTYSFPSKLGIANAQGKGQARTCSGNCCDFTGVVVPDGVDFSSPQWYDSQTDEQKIGDVPIPYVGGDQKLHTKQAAVQRSMAQFSIMQNLAAQHPEYPTFLKTAQDIMKSPSYDPLAEGAEAWLEDAVFAKLRGTAVPTQTPASTPGTNCGPGMVYDTSTQTCYTQAQWNAMHNGGSTTTYVPPGVSPNPYVNPTPYLSTPGPSGVMTPNPGIVSPGGVMTPLPVSVGPSTPAARLVANNGSNVTNVSTVPGSSISPVDAGAAPSVMSTLSLPGGNVNAATPATGGFDVSAVTNWVTANPIIAVGLAVGALLLFRRD